MRIIQIVLKTSLTLILSLSLTQIAFATMNDNGDDATAAPAQTHVEREADARIAAFTAAQAEFDAKAAEVADVGDDYYRAALSAGATSDEADLDKLADAGEKSTTTYREADEASRRHTDAAGHAEVALRAVRAEIIARADADEAKARAEVAALAEAKAAVEEDMAAKLARHQAEVAELKRIIAARKRQLGKG